MILGLVRVGAAGAGWRVPTWLLLGGGVAGGARDGDSVRRCGRCHGAAAAHLQQQTGAGRVQ